MELDPHYCDVIRKRYTKWAKENGKPITSGCLEQMGRKKGSKNHKGEKPCHKNTAHASDRCDKALFVPAVDDEKCHHDDENTD